MLDSRHKPASGEGTPVQVRDGPAAVRGDAPTPRRHWVATREGGGGGSPESEDLPPAATPEPLAEGGFVQRLTIAVVAALAAALAVVSLSAAAHQGTRAKHRFPHRIVSLSPTVTEDLFAVGAGKQVVAVDQDSNYPERAPRTSLSGVTPNVEAIANYHPDLVFISYNPGNFASQLRKLGIKVVNVAAANDLRQAYREILAIGAVTGHTRGAKAVVHSMRTHLAAIVRSVPRTRRHLRVYHELEQDYYSATSNTFIGSIYKLFGFRNIADAAATPGNQYPQLPAE